MKLVKSNLGINVNAITFDEHGEMIVLDNELLELISGGAGKPAPKPTPTPAPPTVNVIFCGSNAYCPSTPAPAPKPVVQ